MGAIALLAVLITSLLVAMIAVSKWLADVLERRQTFYYQQLTTFQQAMDRIMNQEQPK